jgi:hypothetical protein
MKEFIKRFEGSVKELNTLLEDLKASNPLTICEHMPDDPDVEECDICGFVTHSEDYPLGGMLEPYDIYEER